MRPPTLALLSALLIACGLLAAPARAGDKPAMPLLDVAADSALKLLAPSCAQVTAARSQDAGPPGIVVTIQPGAESWPGIRVQPDGPWDLSAYGHVEARLTNLSDKPVSLSLRVDNAGDWKDGPWNCEAIHLQPGATGTVTTIFGYSYGRKPGFKLKPAAVVGLLLFCNKSDAVQKFRIESIAAAGPAGEKPPVDPKSIRIQPPGGVILGAGSKVEPRQIEAKKASAHVATFNGGQSLVATFEPGKTGEASVTLRPPVGRWDLRDCLEVRLKVTNPGEKPLWPRVRVESGGAAGDWAEPPAALEPGASTELVASLVAARIWNGEKNAGNRVANDAVSDIVISPRGDQQPRMLRVESVVAPPAEPAELPAWLGKRPPVDGDWVRTFRDEFDAPAIDAAKWNIYGENYWDKQSHFSKDNVILGGGLVRLRFTKKRGHQNDDPNHKRVTAYATGFLDTYGKWVQRYGYFEARMKMPTAPGLWPAFWMMPDRGVAAGEQWKRQDTGNGGMELDILEHLTRWGPLRFNIAHHWDGYGKDHKRNGSDRVYTRLDKDGYVTAGLLWLPGRTATYYNGVQVAGWENERVSTVASDMMFTLPMGGWDNSPLEDDRLPDDFIIDYVRVWQRRDLASEADTTKRPLPATKGD